MLTLDAFSPEELRWFSGDFARGQRHLKPEEFPGITDPAQVHREVFLEGLRILMPRIF